MGVGVVVLGMRMRLNDDRDCDASELCAWGVPQCVEGAVKSMESCGNGNES